MTINRVHLFARALLLFALTAASALATPAINGVFNAAAWNPPGLPNSGIAQGSIFTVTGSGIGPATLIQAQSYPLPAAQGLAGVTISVTVAGTTKNCIMIYAVSTQVAAILPSATPEGPGTITLNFQGASASTPVQVLSANFGTFTLNEAGSGSAVVTDAAYNPITMINAAHAGDTLVLWGTGLGPVTGDETQPPPEVDLGTGVEVFVGSQQATVTYAGRSSSPGLDQIDFVVPAGANLGCKTSLAVQLKGVTGNVTSTSIAPAGQMLCNDSTGILTSANLQKAIANGGLSIGLVELHRIGSNNDELTAGFGVLPLNILLRSFGGAFNPSPGSCIGFEVSGDTFTLNDPIRPIALDAGPSLTITGPAGTKTAPAVVSGDYSTTLAAQPAEYVQPGAYTVSNGAGGVNVGPFQWNLSVASPVTPVNLPAAVTRAQGLTVSWIGSSPFQQVAILGTSAVPSKTTSKSYVQFLCTAAASMQSFTVPPVILNLLPLNGYGSSGKLGVDLQIAGLPISVFTVSGSPGLDAGIFSIYTSTGGTASVR